MALSSIQYLQENNIPSLIETLLRELLTDRPTNPIAYFKETLDRLSGRSLITTNTSVPTSGYIASVPDPFTEISSLRTECESLRQEVAQLKRNSLELVKRHSDHVASVRQLALEFGKNQLSDKILELGELHADHTASVRVMMNEQLLKATKTPRVLVLFYSTYGHIYHMAKAVADGARETGAQVCLKRVKETLPLVVLEKMNAVQAQEQFAHVPEADTKELASYDCIIIGSPTRFGILPAQMLSFMDATVGLWVSGALVGKVGGVFTSSATQHGGNESTILAASRYFFHQGMMLVGLPYAFQGQSRIDEIVGGSPYGATTIAGGYGQRLPSKTELEGAKFQGKHTATIARKVKY